MANAETQNFPHSSPMVGGDGAHSYANNSAYQGGAVKAAKELIKEGIIEKLDLQILGLNDAVPTTFCIADFGCSTGPNTFSAVQNIIDAVDMKLQHEKSSSSSSPAIQYQVFFNDHTENDFNTLFKSLPQSRNYSAAGVPGSFYSNLFPKSSLNFVHSSYTLHWLSKTPKVDGQKGSIQTRRLANEVIEAYKAQFNNDFQTFLNFRAQELVPGGLAALVIFSSADGIPLADTAGILSEEKVSFDLPMHNPTTKEVEGIIQRNGNFSIERMENMANHQQQILLSNARDFTFAVRAIYEGFFRMHFGDEFVDQIFDVFGTKAEESISSILKKAQKSNIDLFLLLKRI